MVTAAVECTVEHGHDKEGDKGGDGKTSDDNKSHGSPHLGAFAAGGGHGYHAEDGGEGGHQYGTQTALSAQCDGFVERYVALAHEIDVVHQHDAVLDHDADEQHQTEHTDHVEVLSSKKEYEDDTCEGEGDGSDDDGRFAETFELGGHDDVNEHDDEGGKETHVA